MPPTGPLDDAVAPTLAATGDNTLGTAADTPARPPPQLQSGDRLGGRYVILGRLGAGGMGEVYRAHDEVLEVDVALKLVRDEFAERIRDEVRLAQRVTHPNVCRTFDLEELDGRHVVKMEYVAGESLGARLHRTGVMPISEVVRIARAIASGLAATHHAGIVHRDLKPANVLLAGDRVVITDFGLAFRATTERPIGEAGTPGYMAPEQSAGGTIDARSDLYALGCLICALATGAAPNGSADAVAKLRARRDAPRWLARAVTELLALDPAARPRGFARLVAGSRVAKRAVAIAVAIAVISGVAAWWLTRPAATWTPEMVTIGPVVDENADSPALSPDGTTVAFVSSRSGSWAAYTTPFTGGAVHLVARDCWTVRWSRDGNELLMQCRRGGDWRAVAVAIRSTAERDLGPGGGPKPCGDAVLIETIAARTTVGLSRRWRDGRVTPIDLGADPVAITSTSCDDAGTRLAYATNGQVWLIDPLPADGRAAARPRRLDVADVFSLALTPGGTSLVVEQGTGQSSDLYELELATGATHRLTEIGDAAVPTVSRDGAVVVFDSDTTWGAIIEMSRAGVRRHHGAWSAHGLHHLAVAPDARHVAADAGIRGVVAIDLDDDVERVLGPGTAPFLTRDGGRVLFAAGDDPRTLMAVAMGGGVPTRVAQLPGELVDGIDAADGVHVEVSSSGSATRGYVVVGAGAELRDEGVAGLVLPAPAGGWRAIRVTRGRDVVLQVVAPGASLTEPAYELPSWPGRPAWVTDHELSYCDARGCYRYDVVARVVVATVVADHPFEIFAAPDGAHWFTGGSTGHVTRRAIVNFASRPWAP